MLKKCLSANQIKLIAIAAMTADHLAWALFPGTPAVWYVCALHSIGRLAAPIMWFFIAEGCYHTSDARSYIGRLFLFSLISHFAYNFAFGIPYIPFKNGVIEQTSVMWGLTLAVASICICREERVPLWFKVLSLIAACLLSFPADWSSVAVLCPFSLYACRGDFRKQAAVIVFWTLVYGAANILFFNRLYGHLQLFMLFSIPILSMYSGERGKRAGMKRLFYLYYPLHLVVIGLIRIGLHGNVPVLPV